MRSSIPRLLGVLLLTIAALSLVLAEARAEALSPATATTVVRESEAATVPATIGAVCAPDRADQLALSPTGIAPDGDGGFYASNIVHSVVCHVHADGTVDTAAGTGAAGYLPAPFGDDVDGDAGMLFDPYGLSVDGQGSLFIADRGNHRVRRVDGVSGRITTVAGNGAPGRTGDGGPADAASLRAPSDVAVGPAGELYIADSQNHVVRVVAPDGTITTFAGTGVAGSTGDGGRATDASLNRPTGITVDARGRVFIADAGAHRVRMVDAGRIRTVAGTGARGLGPVPSPATAVRLHAPSDVSIDGYGDLLIADSGNSRVLKIVAGVALPMAGTAVPGSSGDGGPALAASLSWPLAVAFDPSTGRTLIADNGATSRVRAVDGAGTITSVAGNGHASWSGDGRRADEAELNQPMAVAVAPDGTVWIADAHNDAIRRVDPHGVISTVVPPAIGLDFPAGLASDELGGVFVADSWGHRVLHVSAHGAVRTVAGTGQPTPTGGRLGDGGPATAATLNVPVGLALDGAGNLYIADSGNRRVRKVNRAGVISTVAGTGERPTADPGTTGDQGTAAFARLDSPTGLALDAADANLYIADPANQRIRRVNLLEGEITTVAGNGRIGFSPDGSVATSSRMNFPRGVVVDGMGLIIADSGNCIVRRLDLGSGRLTTVAGWTPARGLIPTCGSIGVTGAGMLNLPTGLALDAEGDLLIADSLNHRVRTRSAQG